MHVLGELEKSQPPPPTIVWETLSDPRKPNARQWLTLNDDEVEPQIIDSVRPSLVIWSSLWPDRPNDRIRFTIASDGGDGTNLKWSLESPDLPLDDDRLARIRHRINYLINGEMRYSFGQ